MIVFSSSRSIRQPVVKRATLSVIMISQCHWWVDRYPWGLPGRQVQWQHVCVPMEHHAHAFLALGINSVMSIWNKCVNQAKLQVVVPSRYAPSWVHYVSVKSPCAHGAARGILIPHNIGVGRFIKVMVREGLCVVFAVMGISPFELL